MMLELYKETEKYTAVKMKSRKMRSVYGNSF